MIYYCPKCGSRMFKDFNTETVYCNDCGYEHEIVKGDY